MRMAGLKMVFLGWGGLLSVAAVPVIADLPSDLAVNDGSSATVTLSITLSSDLGTETQSDSVTVPVGGGGSILLRPDYEPFNGVDLTSMQFALGNGTLNYEFICTPAFGCVDVTVNLANISATLAQITGATIIETGRADFFAPWSLLADYSIESVLFSSSGNVDTTASVNFGTTWVASGGNIFVHELTLGSIASDVPGDGLPEGVQVSLLTQVDLSNASMSGTYSEPPPAACGSGGPCNSTHPDSGCDDIHCCIAVCEADFYCCENPWDFSCVNLAIQTCGLTPDNDSCSNPRQVGLGRHPFTTTNCTTDGPWLITECQNVGEDNSFINDIWFAYTAKANNGVLLSTCALVNFDTQLGVYDGCNGALLACNNNTPTCGGGHSQLGFYGVAGETYLIRIGGVSGSGSGELDVAWGDVPEEPASFKVQWPTSVGGNGHTYALYALDEGTSFNALILKAQEFGGYPATMTSPEESAFVTTHMPATLLGGATAIGLFQEGDDEPAGGWRWVTGEALDWTNWRLGEPNQAFGLSENWGMMYPDGTWNDQLDTFGNVLIEFDSPPAIDVVTWSAAEGGSGQTYEALLMENRVSWGQAHVFAQSRGGTLVCLETPAEAQWVYEKLASFTGLWSMSDFNSGPWIGLVEGNDGWKWLSEVPFDWPGWSPGEPNGTGDRGCWYGGSRFTNEYIERFGEGVTGSLFYDAGYHNVFGYQRLKLVADGFPGTSGTWSSDPIDERIVAFDASFRFSFKNESGGPGDGFCFFWGDLSDTSGERPLGGEWGLSAFYLDQAGLSVGVASYPDAGQNSIDGRWGSTRFAQTPFDFASVTYNDYQQAGLPENMPTLHVSWAIDDGVSVSIALPNQPPQVIYANEGVGFLANVDTTSWNFGFAGRNGSIDQDVLIGDVIVNYEYLPVEGTNLGGPANTFDDTFDGNQRRGIIIEYPPTIECVGDLTGDGTVDGADLGLLLGSWGACTTSPCIGDLDANGQVNGADLGLMLGAWGSCPE